MAKHPLTEAREKRNISQSKLGLICGISPAHICDIEAWRRYPCPSWRDKISRYFNLPEHELFPRPGDLIDTIRWLTDENNRLQAELKSQSGKTSDWLHKTRDNTQYL